jgi:hypothetical protein
VYCEWLDLRIVDPRWSDTRCVGGCTPRGRVVKVLPARQGENGRIEVG